MAGQIEKTEAYNACKTNCKGVLSAAVIALLAIGSSYLLIQYNNQNKIITAQANYINELKTNFSHNDLYNNIDGNFYRLFDNTQSSLSRSLSVLEDIISKSWDKAFLREGASSYYERIDINTVDDKYTITIALPGFSKEEISIDLFGNTLNIHAKNIVLPQSQNDQTSSDNSKLQKTNEFKQSIKVPNDIDKKNISSTFNNGLLTIILPRIEDKTIKEHRGILIK